MKIWIFWDSGDGFDDKWCVCATQKIARSLMAEKLRWHLIDNIEGAEIPNNDDDLIAWYEEGLGEGIEDGIKENWPFVDVYFHVDEHDVITTDKFKEGKEKRELAPWLRQAAE